MATRIGQKGSQASTVLVAFGEKSTRTAADVQRLLPRIFGHPDRSPIDRIMVFDGVTTATFSREGAFVAPFMQVLTRAVRSVSPSVSRILEEIEAEPLPGEDPTPFGPPVLIGPPAPPRRP